MNKNESLWHILVCESLLALNSLDSLLLKLLYGTLFHKYSHGIKKYFYSKLIAT